MRKVLMVAFAAVCFFFGGTSAKAQRLAVGTNALEWLASADNAQLVVVTGERTTLHLDGLYSRRPFGEEIRLFSISPEVRYWFIGRPFTKFFVGATGGYNDYWYKRKDEEHLGYAFTAGATAGYDFLLGKKVSLDLTIGAGVARYREKDGGVGFCPVPLKLGVSLFFIID